ncbi:hypothetical protein C8Q76DRAFT_753446 [Earliella scabrosa]|nr:hypothetical protein C8Q76DRAFT_753446 [Earliella scabrosa]
MPQPDVRPLLPTAPCSGLAAMLTSVIGCDSSYDPVRDGRQPRRSDTGMEYPVGHSSLVTQPRFVLYPTLPG